MKCDYCDNLSTNELMYSTIQFCLNHVKEALDEQAKTVKALEEWEEYKENKYFHGDKK